jgi:hypothetical protein
MDEFQRTIKKALKKLGETRQELEAMRSPFAEPPDDPPPAVAMAQGRRRSGGQLCNVPSRVISRRR